MAQREKRTLQKNPGFSLIEVSISMAVGSLFIVGLVSFSQFFQKGLKQVQEIGDYSQLKDMVYQQLKSMSGGNCHQYIPSGTPMSSSTPVPVTLLKNPNTTGAEITPSMIRFNADGSTIIDGNQYILYLKTIDPKCFDDDRASCKGRLTLTMTRLGKNGDGKGYFGVKTHSQDLTDITFNLNDLDSHLWQNCSFQYAPWPAEVEYRAIAGSSGCKYPPMFPDEPAPFGTNSDPLTCPPGFITLGVCGSGMNSLGTPPSSPSPVPATSYSPTYCNNNTAGVNVQMGCCALRDLAQIRTSEINWQVRDCNTEQSEVVIGVCSGGRATPAISTDPYPNNPTSCPAGKHVECAPIYDVPRPGSLNSPRKINYLTHFCHTESNIAPGEMKSCDYGEVMTGYCSPETCGRASITCCPITVPL